METAAAENEEWERYGAMCPRLRPHVGIHRQYFRGELWYVIENNATGRFHRITPAAYQLIGRLDGRRRLSELLPLCRTDSDREGVIDKEALIQLIRQLSHSDLLQLEGSLNIDFYRRRLESHRSQKSWRRFLNPLALKLPLLDPDEFLNHTQGLGRLVFSPWGLAVWFLTLIYALGLAGVHWQGLTNNFVDRVLGADNILMLLLIFPLIKVFHELGHGYAAKRWGGEVHEIGVMFLVFMPIPYVDASSITSQRERYRRMVVAAAGMLVETFLAALAMILWVNAEPGIVRAVAFNVIFLASVSTLLFNGNPLLRYDGYYMLSDYLEMPNLGPRANAYFGYLVQRYIYHADLSAPDNARGEKVCLFIYAILSFFYRMFVWLAIILFVATKFFFFGVLLAVWGGTLMMLRPLYRLLNYLFTSPVLAPVRTRAVGATSAILCALLGLLFLVPVPYSKLYDGVVWMSEGSLVRAQASGFIVEIDPVAASSERLPKGHVLLVMEDPLAQSEVNVLRAQKEELTAEYQALQVQDRVRADVVSEHMLLLNSRLEKAEKNLQDMLVRGQFSGRFVPVLAGDLIGRYVQKGQLLGYLFDGQPATIKTIVNQADYILVRDRFVGIDALFVEDQNKPFPLTLIHQVPAASDRLPSRALSQAGGGDYFLDPTDAGGNKALQSHFEFELAMVEALPTERSGGRVYVRFDLGSEPLFWRGYRSVRHLFLEQFAL